MQSAKRNRCFSHTVLQYVLIFLNLFMFTSQTSSEIVRTMLRMSEVTTSPTATCTKPLSANEIFRSLPSSYNILRPILDQYLTLLVDDPVRPPPPQGTLCVVQFYAQVCFFSFHQHVLFPFPRWSLWGRLVRVEEGCTLSVSFCLS